MNRIKYLMSLPPEKMLLACQMVAIMFLCGNLIAVKYEARSDKEKAQDKIYELQNKISSVQIDCGNRLLDFQKNRADQLDSQITESKKIIEQFKFKQTTVKQKK